MLTAIEQALYCELVAIWAEYGCADYFRYSNNGLCLALGISKKALIKSRESLIEAGLLYYEPGKSKLEPCVYSLSVIPVR